MAADHRIRHYMVLQAGDLRPAVRSDSPADAADAVNAAEAWQTHLTNCLRDLDLGDLSGMITVRVIAPPSPRWNLVLMDKDGRCAPVTSAPMEAHVGTLELNIPGHYELSHERVGDVRSKLKSALPGCLHMGADIPVHGTTYWSPTGPADWLFGDREQAGRLIAAPYLKARNDATGEGVNVVVVDQGVDAARIPNFGGGWQKPGGPAPGTTKNGHGAMLVRNVLDIAPNATIFDFPLITGIIPGSRAFLSDAHAAYLQMLGDIATLQQSERWQGPWVFLNAWAIFDRRTEWPRGDHTADSQHALNLVIEATVDRHFDVVFCAGNCGQFCPMQLCGEHDRGPGHSILGANSHPKVLTVGAVRVDGTWLGYSSQGPGQFDPAVQESPDRAQRKPDLCAPSQFGEVDDSYTSNTGTSAASAVAAGAVAALRSRWGYDFTPAELKNILMDTARKTEGAHWNGRLGHGILDLDRAYQKASTYKPGQPGSIARPPQRRVPTSPPRMPSAPE
jgi:subtilisin family serine protease